MLSLIATVFIGTFLHISEPKQTPQLQRSVTMAFNTPCTKDGVLGFSIPGGRPQAPACVFPQTRDVSCANSCLQAFIIAKLNLIGHYALIAIALHDQVDHDFQVCQDVWDFSNKNSQDWDEYCSCTCQANTDYEALVANYQTTHCNVDVAAMNASYLACLAACCQ